MGIYSIDALSSQHISIAVEKKFLKASHAIWISYLSYADFFFVICNKLRGNSSKNHCKKETLVLKWERYHSNEPLDFPIAPAPIVPNNFFA